MSLESNNSRRRGEATQGVAQERRIDVEINRRLGFRPSHEGDKNCMVGGGWGVEGSGVKKWEKRRWMDGEMGFQASSKHWEYEENTERRLE